MLLSDQALEELGWDEAATNEILRSLGFIASKPQAGAPRVWRRRNERPAPAGPRPDATSPFAALAALRPAPKRRSRKPRKARA